MEHTPWFADLRSPTWLVIDSNGETVADCGPGQDGKEWAERIILRCNAHDKLVEALRMLPEWGYVSEKGYVEGCFWCHQHRDDDHTDDCRRQAALAQSEDE